MNAWEVKQRRCAYRICSGLLVAIICCGVMPARAGGIVGQTLTPFTQPHPGAPAAMPIYDSTNGPGGSGSAGLVFSTNSPNASIGDDLTFDALPEIGRASC